MSIFEKDITSWDVERWILHQEFMLHSGSHKTTIFSDTWNRKMIVYGKPWTQFKKTCQPENPNAYKISQSLFEQLMDEDVIELLDLRNDEIRKVLEKENLTKVYHLFEKINSEEFTSPISRFGSFCFYLRKIGIPSTSFFIIACLSLFSSYLKPIKNKNI
jgi:hypothetical protein